MIKIEINPMLASCLQRMIVDEIDNQTKWKKEDKKLGADNTKMRDEIIKGFEELSNQLEKQGVHKHIKCY